MSDAGHPLERFLQSTARRVSGGLHPVEVLRRVEEVVAAAANGGLAPNDIVVAFHPADYTRYRAGLPQLQAGIAAMLDDLQDRAGWRLQGDRRVRLESVPAVAEGTPRVTARFADRRPVSRPPAGATQRIARHRNLVLVLSSGERVTVTHTPFTIGRGPANDLVLASMAVSRTHAEIVRDGGGYCLRDRGSRNGLLVGGERVESVVLAPGVVVTVGDLALSLERVL